MADHELSLLGLQVTDSTPDADHEYVFNVIANDYSFGAAGPVQEVVTSLLADGDLTRITRFGNREVTFLVEISGPSLASLAHGEAALRNVVGRSGDLVWQPPDDTAVPTAFDVITSSMEFLFDDLAELRHRRRVFRLTLTCLPAARSLYAANVSALPAGSTTVVVDACNSLTGWAAADSSPADTLSVSGGAVYVYDAASGGNDQVGLRRAAAIDMAGFPYFILEWKSYPGPGFTILGLPAQTSDPFPSEVNRTALADGWFRSTWAVSSGSLASGFQFGYLNASGSPSGDYLAIREVRKSDVLPGETPRQVTRVFDVGGTERTSANIHVTTATGTGSLTQAIVHTCPEDGTGYSPPLRRWRTAASTGPETTDAATYSGKYEPIAFAAGGFYSEVPTLALPAGGYTLVARIRLAGSPPAAVTVFYSTSTIFPGGTSQEGFTNGSTVVTLSDTNWTLVPVATLSLPSVRTNAGKVQVVLQTSTTHAQVYLDEAWVFREDDDCALTIVDTARSHLWLSSPDSDSPVPTVSVGDSLDSRVHPGSGLKAMGAHVLSPEGTAVFTAALTNNPATDATFFRRWLANAAS